LHSANASKTDCKEESKGSFGHGGERKQTVGLQSTHFQRTNPFSAAEKRQNDYNFASHNVSNSGALGELKI
jgi:hypothetical protein